MINKTELSLQSKLGSIFVGFYSKKNPLYLTGIIVFSIALYSLTFKYPFLWDDSQLIANSPNISKIENIADAFTKQYLYSIQTVQSDTPYYRPISLAFIYVEKFLFGNSPIGYRITHFLIHLLSSLLLYQVIISMCCLFQSTSASNQTKTSAAQAVFIFLVLPYSVDAVLFLTNLGDLMVLSFTLLAILIFSSVIKHASYSKALMIFLLTLLSCGSKETGIVVPIVLSLIFLFAYRQSVPRKSIIVLSLFGSFVGVLIFLISRNSVLGLAREFSFLTAIKNFPLDFLLALRWGLFPHPLALMETCYDRNINLLWFAGITSIILFCLTIVLTRKHKCISFGISLWGTLVAPSLLGLQFAQFFSSRYLYCPAIGIAIVVAAISLRGSRLIRYSIVACVFLLLLLTIVRIDAWKSNASLWTRETELHQDNPVSMTMYGRLLIEEGLPMEAMAAYQQALKMAEQLSTPSRMAEAHFNIAILYEKQFKNPSRAFTHYVAAAKLNPTHTTWIGIGDIHARYDKNFNKALEAFKVAEKLQPESYQAMMAISSTYSALHDYTKAFEYLDKAEKLVSNQPKLLKKTIEERSFLKSFLKSQHTNTTESK